MVRVGDTTSTKHADLNISNVLHIKHLVSQVEMLKDVTNNFKCSLLSTINEVLNDPRIKQLADIIYDTIRKDLNIDMKKSSTKQLRCYAIREGKSGLLDIARKAFDEANQDLIDIIQKYSDEYELNIKVQSRNGTKYHMAVPHEDFENKEIPEELVNVSKKKNSYTFTSISMIKCNERLFNSVSEITLMSDKIIMELLETIKMNIHVFYKISEAIGLLDMIFSFSQACTFANCVRPDFSNVLIVKNSRHPILDSSEPNECVMPNDIEVTEEKNFIAITGPNMSGKSTYVRQVAMIQIMAQIGMFLPAESAVIKIHDQIFARLNHDDSLEFNASSFMVEMQELSFILHSFDDHSMVIIDELGRGTSVMEGVAMTTAILEVFLKSKATVFFTTHFLELPKMLGGYPNFTSFHFLKIPKLSEPVVDNDSDQEATSTGEQYDTATCSDEFLPRPVLPAEKQGQYVAETYKLKRGWLEARHYGIELAKKMKFPKDIIDTAEVVAIKLLDKSFGFIRNEDSIDVDDDDDPEEGYSSGNSSAMSIEKDA
ncbi:MutS protein msh4 [Mycoemilia scoparia]|uniref:MutS protein msh4 n=1 Tax=Mycoemilia scoparia TaxID=417184 RepID=A0A9W7ZS41_9FUNG|nr:MutS protein msh4 [Mycoemilia scoparia]